MSKWILLGVAALLGGLLDGCLPGFRGSAGKIELEGVLVECARRLGQAAGSGEIVVLGVRDSTGKVTDSTRLLEERLVSALLIEEVPVVRVAPESKWASTPEVPIDEMGTLPEERVLVGRLYERENRAYFRYWLVQREGGYLEQSGTLMLDGDELAHLVAQGKGRAESQLEVELHLIARRSEGGELLQIDLEEGGVLKPGDQLQLRFRPRADGQFYSFIIDSEAQRQELFPLSFIYTGPIQESAWFTLAEPDRVYTLYFIAAVQLENDREELFTDLDELIKQRQVDRFEGLNKMDERVSKYAGRQLETVQALEVLRGREGVALGQVEKIIYDDGTTVESRAEKLRAAKGLIRTISFEIQ